MSQVGETDGEPDFVLCDGCPKGGHYQCLGLPGVPEGDWFCADCVKDKETAPSFSPRKVPSNDDFDEEPLGRGSRARRCTTWWITTTTTGSPGPARETTTTTGPCATTTTPCPTSASPSCPPSWPRTISQEKELARLHRRLAREKGSAPKPRRPTPKKDAEHGSKKVDELLRFTQRCARFPRKTAKTLAPSTLSSKQALVRRWRWVMIVSDAGIDAGDEVRAEPREEETRVRRGDADADVRKPAVPEGGRRVLGRRRVIGDRWTTRS